MERKDYGSFSVLTSALTAAVAPQAYGPGALKGMLAWLRHVAQAIGSGSLADEPLRDTEESQIYQQVRRTRGPRGGCGLRA